jgi:hypothetical protein
MSDVSIPASEVADNTQLTYRHIPTHTHTHATRAGRRGTQRPTDDDDDDEECASAAGRDEDEDEDEDEDGRAKRAIQLQYCGATIRRYTACIFLIREDN